MATKLGNEIERLTINEQTSTPPKLIEQTKCDPDDCDPRTCYPADSNDDKIAKKQNCDPDDCFPDKCTPVFSGACSPNDDDHLAIRKK